MNSHGSRKLHPRPRRRLNIYLNFKKFTVTFTQFCENSLILFFLPNADLCVGESATTQQPVIKNSSTCDAKAPKDWRSNEERLLISFFLQRLSHVAKFFSLRNPNERRSVAQNCENCWIKNTDSKRRSADFFILSLRTFVWPCVCLMYPHLPFSVPFPLLCPNFSSFVRRGNILHSSRRHGSPAKTTCRRQPFLKVRSEGEIRMQLGVWDYKSLIYCFYFIFFL